MKTKTIKLYQFGELPKAVKDKIIERERYINTDYEWSELTLDEWRRKLAELGFPDAVISFSGFYSQGDGASFTCKTVNVPLFLAKQGVSKRFALFWKAIKKGNDDVEVNASVDRIDHHYAHENTITVNVESYDKEGYALPQTLEVTYFMRDIVRTLSRKIYKELEVEYEGLTSDEAVIDAIESNEYYFTESGRMESYDE